MNEKVRYLQKAPPVDFKRPSHPDFMTTTEIKGSKFTGLRVNSLAARVEFWIKGILEWEFDIPLIADQTWIENKISEKMSEMARLENHDDN